MLVIEGIHCLNPELTENLSDENKFKIYISALTQLNIDEHNRIPTTDGRLIRRIVRDARTTRSFCNEDNILCGLQYEEERKKIYFLIRKKRM